MTGLRRFVGDVWILTKGYWGSDERWSAWALLVAIIVLNLSLVGVNVLQNEAGGTLFTALQERNAHGFYRALIIVVLLILLYLAVAVLRVYLDQTFQLRWRRWMTDQFVTRWLADRAFYRMRFSGRVDNPYQRISEDVRLFIERTMGLGVGFLNALATLASFATLLWYLSGSITLPIGNFTITISGYMFWMAVLFSGIGSVIAHLIGRPLINLNNRQQAAEADFRFNLVRLREEAEAIALYGGEAQERGITLGRFRTLYDNFKRIILRSNQFLVFQLLFSQGTSSFALLIASPRYFSGAIQLGVLTQTANAFERVNEALSWFIGSYTAFAQWRATVDRLTEFAAEIKPKPDAPVLGTRIETAAQNAIGLHDVGVSLPNGTPMLAPITLHLKPHQSVLLKGPSGSGKSTLFRVLAGLWPFATGRIRLPANAKTLFLPQRPYMPIGTLREALWFPALPASDGEAEARAALASVGLSALSPRLDENAHWTQALSLGEQQRIAVARALLAKPDWLFLDEATSAIDEEEEAALYRMIAKELPATTVISIGHRESLEAYHRRVITIDRVIARPGRLTDRARDQRGV
ncbi:MAG: ABC transporter ATP-binding protein/permease [Stellaceae bacterium]|jgi:putative ATP-binding cassette transporter